MRFIPINCIRDGAILGKALLGGNGEVLLREGAELRTPYIKRLTALGLHGVYINDSLSEDLEIVNILSDELRIKALQGVKNGLADAGKGSPANARQNAEHLQQTSLNIVDELLSKDSIVFNMVDIKTYDGYTFQHSLAVAILSVLLGISLGYNRSKLAKLAYSAILHDIGKVFIDSKIINKPDKLTAEEYEQVKRHPSEGYIYLREQYGMTEISARGVVEHHERYDGNGYPRQKAGHSISEFGRIISVADVYDALVSDRPYRKGLFAAEALEYLMGNSGRMFDPDMIQLFLRKVALFPVGTCVLLSDGRTALVMENFEGFTQRPLVKVFNADGHEVQPYLLDLCHDYQNLNITIVATVNM